MKKSFRLLSVLFMAFAVSLPALANKTLTLFDGDDLSNTAPINHVYLDEVGTRTQVIFPADSLLEMKGEVINSMKFYTDSPITVNGGSIQVFLVESDKEDYYDAIYVDSLNHVASITMVEGTTEVEVIFDTPYPYMGGNLIFETVVNEVASDYCFVTYLGIRPTYYSAISRGEISKFLPKTTFNYGTNDAYSAKVLPFELTFKTIRAERTDTLTIEVTNTGLEGFTPAFITDAPFKVNVPNAVIPAGETLAVPVVFAPTEAGNYTGTLSVDCGPAGIHDVIMHGSAIEAAEALMVGDSTDYASYVPIYGLDIDVVGTRGQVIYPSRMLNEMVGRKIVGIQYHIKDYVEMDGGVIQLSLKEVNDTAYSSTYFINELTAVATYTPVHKSTEMVFYFNEPFEYHGGNLVVDCSIIEAGTTTYRQTFFYGTPTDYPAGIYRSLWYGSTFDTELVPFLPCVTFDYMKDEAPSYMRGDVDQNGNVNINDVTALINILLNDIAAPTEADCNLDKAISITDVTALINFLLTDTWNN